MDSLAAAVVAGAPAEELERLPVPGNYPAAHLRVEDSEMFKETADKDVRKSIRIGEVPMPELAPDEVLIAVMASGINYNTVWSAMFTPISTFAFLRSFGRQGGWAARHDQPYHVLGSDAAGVIVRVGSGVRHWRIGDHVLVSAPYVDDQDPLTHMDGMLGIDQRAWGFETNFGGLAHYAVARTNQLLAKPAALTWEEAAATPLCAATAYRMLVGERGARMKQGDLVLVWGATGGLGSYAVQFVRNGGGVPIGVVSSEEKAAKLRKLGCDLVINRHDIGLVGSDLPDPADVGKKLGKIIRATYGEDPHIVFEHTGRATFGVSVFAVRRGGSVVTCGSTTGYQHEFDNRYLWMRLKRVIGSHGANYQEAWETNRLISQGRIRTALSVSYRMEETAEAARLVQENKHVGKVGVLCLAPSAGLGVTDPELRAQIDDVAPYVGLQ
ncbi:crotonyl-CoA carboxylase/reductase [Micromonospora sp. WMMD1155]|uniref:crotonyl-CoA carboxylase/reductase n=1 Tax=Micromonospora sp. WMMD1155 TaxID=3016094 RepID=UPI00249CEE07|nr:crotonyl-CoA carboxylase/reductase [Micromonospora sp. WMMD1155]WFE54845.1 crotonyl-CoA carboxylase/reductase [Micromonospora sp. WMMD1155]